MSQAPSQDQRKPITLSEVRGAFEPLSETYPPILSLKHAALISGYTEGTLKKKLSEGCFRNSVSRGKPLLFWRDRFVLELMNRPRPAKHITKGKQRGGDYEAN